MSISSRSTRTMNVFDFATDRLCVCVLLFPFMAITITTLPSKKDSEISNEEGLQGVNTVLPDLYETVTVDVLTVILLVHHLVHNLRSFSDSLYPQ